MSSNGAGSASVSMLADLIQERTGLKYEASRMQLLEEKISALVAKGNYGTILDYYYYLKYDPHAEGEWQRLQAALAVNETYFWREYGQIQTAVEVIVPILQQSWPNQPVRIWHAACATGEEPYTMAIALKEAGRFDAGPIEIDATDFNAPALSQARAGVYRERSFRAIPPDILSRYFQQVNQGHYRLDEAIRARVSFSYLNLLDKSAMQRMRGYDIIFCRNAFIYFSDAAIRTAAEYMYRAAKPSGYLFVSAAESLLRFSSHFDLVEIAGSFAYHRREQPKQGS